jgi:hypothetical protein
MKIAALKNTDQTIQNSESKVSSCQPGKRPIASG